MNKEFFSKNKVIFLNVALPACNQICEMQFVWLHPKTCKQIPFREVGEVWAENHHSKSFYNNKWSINKVFNLLSNVLALMFACVVMCVYICV